MAENSSAPLMPNREERSFKDIGLDPRLIRALIKKDLQNPTPIQRVTIPLVLEGKDVVSIAKTGSGKTFSYLLPLFHKLLSGLGSDSSNVLGPAAFVLVPNIELIQQVYSEVMSLIALCGVELKVAQLTSSMSYTELNQALSGPPPDVLVSTPACVHKCLSTGVLQPKAIQESLSMLILDEAHLFLSYGYEDDLMAFSSHVPRRCQCLLMSATSSDDLEKLMKLILHKPYLVTPPEEDGGKDEIIPNNVDQFWISCGAQDKFLHILALLKLDLVQKKALLFINTIDMGFRLKLFLEQFAISSAFLNAELPQNSRLHIIEEFNAGLFDCLIAIADGETNTKEQEAAGKIDAEMINAKKQLRQKLDTEFDVVRGIDFKNVYTVINFQMPSTAAGYLHHIGCTGRACNTITSIFLVSPDEMEAFGELKSTLAEHRSGGDFIAPFPSLRRREVESLRYRTEDIERTVTRVHVRKARAEAILGTKIEDMFGTEIEDILGTEIPTLNCKFVLKQGCTSSNSEII